MMPRPHGVAADLPPLFLLFGETGPQCLQAQMLWTVSKLNTHVLQNLPGPSLPKRENPSLWKREEWRDFG